jgi:hypothetical protein
MTASHHVYEQFENTPLWRALAKALKDLETSRELTLDTAPHYVIGYLCQELAAKHMIAAPSLARDG